MATPVMMYDDGDYSEDFRSPTMHCSARVLQAFPSCGEVYSALITLHNTV